MPSCFQSSQCVEYDAFRHFKRVCFLGDPEPAKRLVAVFSTMGDFTFYGDESYGDVDAYSVAGYLASVEQWESFIAAWKELCKDEEFTVLHKADLETNVEGSEFEWLDLSAEEKYEKKKANQCSRLRHYLKSRDGRRESMCAEKRVESVCGARKYRVNENRRQKFLCGRRVLVPQHGNRSV
jgi:hypothetical protein